MAFRFYKNVIDHPHDLSPLVVVSGDKLVVQNLNVPLPRSCDYSLKDLLAAGVPVAPVDSTVIHDNSSTLDVAKNVIDNSSTLVVDKDPVDNPNN